MSIAYIENELYAIEFYGHQLTTRVTLDPLAVNEWVELNLHNFDENVIAVASKPFRNGLGLALLQIFCKDSCLVYQISHANGAIPASLRNVFGNPNYTVVGVSINKIRRIFSRRYNLPIVHSIQLRHWVLPEQRNCTIQRLSRDILEMPYHVPWKIKRSRWTKRALGRRQVLYATLDAFVSHLLADRLLD